MYNKVWSATYENQKIKKYMRLCTSNNDSNLDNMSNTHNIIRKGQKDTYTQKQQSKNHTSPPL